MEANATLKGLKDLSATLVHRPPPNDVLPQVRSFSEASFNIPASHPYRKTGVITEIEF